jgi:hypothetical protein
MLVNGAPQRRIAKAGGLRGPEAIRERGWGEAQTQGLARGLQRPEARFYLQLK